MFHPSKQNLNKNRETHNQIPKFYHCAYPLVVNIFGRCTYLGDLVYLIQSECLCYATIIDNLYSLSDQAPQKLCLFLMVQV